jgi:hypothetical protein
LPLFTSRKQPHVRERAIPLIPQFLKDENYVAPEPPFLDAFLHIALIFQSRRNRFGSGCAKVPRSAPDKRRSDRLIILERMEEDVKPLRNRV